MRLVAGAALLLQTALLYWPRITGPEGGLPVDKVAHLATFAGVAALGVWAGVPVRWVVLILVGQAVVSELVQAFLLEGRGGDPWDLVADLAGIVVGIVAAARWRPALLGPT